MKTKKHYIRRAPDKCSDLTYKYLVSLLPKKLSGKLLDLGCYKGYLRNYLPTSVKYVGLDIDKWFPGIVIHDLNKGKLPFKNKKFDYVVASNILEHLFYPDKILKEMRRVLKPGGIAIITLPNDEGIGHKLTGQFGLFTSIEPFEQQKYKHHWIFSLKTAKDFISREFKIVEIKTFNGMILGKLDFILKHFPRLCTDFYFKVIK